MLRNREKKPIATIEDWKKLAPPKSKDQWEKGRSAMELARAWTRMPGRCAPPAELEALLQTHAAFSDVRIVSGIAEDHVRFDEFSGPRNADLNVLCESPRGCVVISIEAKADESYGGTVGAQLRAAKRRSDSGKRTNAGPRAEALVRRFAPNAQDPHNLRYQLLTATAAMLRFAEQHQAATALLLIHEFINGKRKSGVAATTKTKIEANAKALNTFVREVSAGDVTTLVAPTIVGPFGIEGRSPSFYIGKLQTDLGKRSIR